MNVASGACSRAASQQVQRAVGVDARSRSAGRDAAQSCEGCAAVWTTSSRSRRRARRTTRSTPSRVADVELARGGTRRELAPAARSVVRRVDASGPKKRARMSFSMPTTSKPRSAKWRTDSEPMSPPEPVTMAMGMERCRIAFGFVAPRAPAILVESVSKTFRHPTERVHTLKERALHPFRRAAPTTLAGAARRRLRGRARASSSASSAATARARARCSSAWPASTRADAGAHLRQRPPVDVHRARRRLQPRPRGRATT